MFLTVQLDLCMLLTPLEIFSLAFILARNNVYMVLSKCDACRD